MTTGIGDRIDVPINFSGTSEAAEGLDRVTGSLQRGDQQIERYDQRTQRFSDTQRRAAQEMATFSARISAAGSILESFGRRIGDETVRALGQFTAELGRGAAAGIQLGQVFGPEGAIVGGIVGALIPAFETLEERIAAADTTSETYRQHLRELGNTARETARRMREVNDIQAGVFGADSSDERLFQMQEEHLARIRDLDGDIYRLEQSMQRDHLQRDDTTLPQLDQELSQARTELGGIQREIERRRAAEAVASGFDNPLDPNGRPVLPGSQTPPATSTRTGRGGGAGRAAERWTSADAEADGYGRARDAAEQYAAAVEAVKSREQQALDAAHDAERERQEQEKRWHEEGLARSREAADEHIASVRAQMEAEDWAIQHDQQVRRARLEQARQDTRQLSDLVGGSTELFVDAMGQVVSGSKSSEDAFKGLLKGFLEMISKMSVMKAGFEFAEAIAAAATENWGGFARHVAAGIAFTAVAVATGAGAAALAPPQQQTKPAEPPATNSSSQRGGDIVVNLNSPVVTAGTHAQLGRELRIAIQRADRMGL